MSDPNEMQKIYNGADLQRLSVNVSNAVHALYDGFIKAAEQAGMDSPKPYATYCTMVMLSGLTDSFAESASKYLDAALMKCIENSKVEL